MGTCSADLSTLYEEIDRGIKGICGNSHRNSWSAQQLQFSPAPFKTAENLAWRLILPRSLDLQAKTANLVLT